MASVAQLVDTQAHMSADPLWQIVNQVALAQLLLQHLVSQLALAQLPLRHVVNQIALAQSQVGTGFRIHAPRPQLTDSLRRIASHSSKTMHLSVMMRTGIATGTGTIHISTTIKSLFFSMASGGAWIPGSIRTTLMTLIHMMTTAIIRTTTVTVIPMTTPLVTPTITITPPRTTVMISQVIPIQVRPQPTRL